MPSVVQLTDENLEMIFQDLAVFMEEHKKSFFQRNSSI